MAKANHTLPIAPLPADLKERRLRQWAAQIVSNLPADEREAARVLKLAGELRRSWLGGAK